MCQYSVNNAGPRKRRNNGSFLRAENEKVGVLRLGLEEDLFKCLSRDYHGFDQDLRPNLRWNERLKIFFDLLNGSPCKNVGFLRSLNYVQKIVSRPPRAQFVQRAL